MWRAGPTGRLMMRTPGAHDTLRSWPGESRRVKISTSKPSWPRCLATSSTYTFWPPASSPPRRAAGLACSLMKATLILIHPSGTHLPERSISDGEFGSAAEHACSWLLAFRGRSATTDEVGLRARPAGCFFNDGVPRCGEPLETEALLGDRTGVRAHAAGECGIAEER